MRCCSASCTSLPNVTVITGAQTTEVLGDGERVIGLKYKERSGGEMRSLELAGVFVQIGLVPNTDWLKGTVKLSPRGEVEVDARGADLRARRVRRRRLHHRALQADRHCRGRRGQGVLERLRPSDSLAPVGGRLTAWRRLRIRARRLSAGVVVVHVVRPRRADTCCCAPTGTGISPKAWSSRARTLRRGAARSARGNDARGPVVRLGQGFIDTGPYNKGKISRYYLARSIDTHVTLPINPELGLPEHHEARWVESTRRHHGVAAARTVVHWARATIKF